MRTQRKSLRYMVEGVIPEQISGLPAFAFARATFRVVLDSKRQQKQWWKELHHYRCRVVSTVQELGSVTWFLVEGGERELQRLATLPQVTMDSPGYTPGHVCEMRGLNKHDRAAHNATLRSREPLPDSAFKMVVDNPPHNPKA